MLRYEIGWHSFPFYFCHTNAGKPLWLMNNAEVSTEMERSSGWHPWYLPETLKLASHKGQWRGALMFSLICAWINGWVNNREAGDLKHHRTHYDVIVMTRCVITAMGIPNYSRTNIDIFVRKRIIFAGKRIRVLSQENLMKHFERFHYNIYQYIRHLSKSKWKYLC